MRTFLKYLVVIILLSFSFELIFKVITIRSLHNLFENCLFAFLIVLVIELFNPNRIKLLVSKFLFIFFSLSTLTESLYYYLFDTYFNTSAVFVILETNFQEAKEFLISKLDIFSITYAVIFFVVTLIMYFKLNFKKKIQQFKSMKRLKVGISILTILLFLKFSTLIIYNFPYLVLRTPLRYYEDTKNFNYYGKENPLGDFKDVKFESKTNKKLYIVIIGESTNRYHFQLYNQYYRNTTPLLKEIEDELFVFRDVISPHTYTIASLSKALTLGNYENPKKQYKGSVIQLFNSAGFSTFWLSTQRPVGVMDTKVTKIATGAKNFTFFSTKHTNEKTPYDIDLVKGLKKVIEKEGDKKVVFLHMLGTHIEYKKRYPSTFSYFFNKPKTNFKSQKSFEIINSYDNAIKYNDFILRSVIETVRSENVESYVLYFSDHGQEVYNEKDFFGHTLDEEVTKDMYEIPFFLWTSKSYKRNNNFSFNINKKYMIDDLIHSIADISNISSAEIDSTRSIFSEDFIERKRIIKDSIDFDLFFN